MNKVLPESNCRVAVVGAGYFGAFHYDAWSRIPGVDLVGLCDPNADQADSQAQTLAARYGKPDTLLPIFKTVTDLCDATGPDLVDITSPPHTHLALIQALAPRVGHIICQKPFCEDSASAATAVVAAREHNARLAVHENIRFQPWYREIKFLINRGVLGELYQVSFFLRPGDGQGVDAYLARQPYFQTMPRFMVHETGIHWVDTFRFLMGEMSGVSARLTRRNSAIAGEDGGILLFEFENGATGLFDGNRLADHAALNCRLTLGELCLEGSRGTVRLDGDGNVWIRRFGENTEQRHDFAWSDHLFGGDCVYACNHHIVTAWRRGEEAETEARLYLRNQQIEDAIYASADSGMWQLLQAQPTPDD